MKTFSIRLLLTIILIYGCSSDNDSFDKPIMTNITVIGSKNLTVYQANINNGEIVATYDLTQELGFPDNNISLYSKDYYTTLHFYHGSSYYEINKTWEKDLITGSHMEYNISCITTNNVISNRPITYGDNVLLIDHKFENNQYLNNVIIYNKSIKQCHTLNLGEGFFNPNDQAFFYYKDYLLVYHVNNLRNTIIFKINSSNYIVEDQLVLNGMGGVTLNDDKLYFFQQTSEQNYFEFDFDTFQLTHSGKFTSGFPNFTGFLETSFEGGKMLMLADAAQPSPINWIPMITDLDSGTIVKQIDPFLIWRNLQKLDGIESLNIGNVKFKVNINKEIVIGNYEKYINSNEKAYGIFFSDFDSNIIKTVDLDFQPGDIIIKQ